MKLDALIFLNLLTLLWGCDSKVKSIADSKETLFRIQELSVDGYGTDAILGNYEEAQRIEQERLRLQAEIFKAGTLLKFQAENGCTLRIRDNDSNNQIGYSCSRDSHSDNPLIQEFHYTLRIRNLPRFKLNGASIKELVMLLEPEILNPDCVIKPECFHRSVIIDKGYSYVPTILGLAVTINSKQ